MLRWMFASAIGAALLCDGDRPTVTNLSTPEDSIAVVLEQSVDKLNRVANDTTAKRSDRAAAVFALFKQHLKPGDSLQRVRLVLRNTDWVEHSKLYYFAFLSGFIPIDMNFDDRTYSLHLFADEKGSSEWVVYFQLAGKSEWGKCAEDGIAFLHGKTGSQGESRIKEFTLCYPGGSCEIFSPRLPRTRR
jgi:hypothetical protein